MILVFWCNRRFCILFWISNNLMLQWQPINAFNTNSNWAKYLSFAYIVILCRLFTENNLSSSSFLPLTLMYRKIASLANIVMQNDFPSVDRRSCFKYIYFCCCSVYVCFFSFLVLLEVFQYLLSFKLNGKFMPEQLVGNLEKFLVCFVLFFLDILLLSTSPLRSSSA